MLRLTNFDGSQCRRWCALIVLLAVCSLTVSVATRYTSSRGASSNRVLVVQRHVSPAHGRQRLIKDAANWLPPVVSCDVQPAPCAYPRIAPAGPPIPGLIFEESLYYRPPPALAFLA